MWGGSSRYRKLRRAIIVFDSGPAAVHARQLKSKDCTVRTFVPEGLSDSSPVRSAGNEAKRDVRPTRDDRNIRLLVSHTAQRLPALIDRPVRDG